MKEKDVLGICKRKALKIYIEECHVKKKDSEFAMAKIYYHAYLKGFVAGWKEVLEELKYEDCSDIRIGDVPKWIIEWGARTKKDWLISGREPIDEENPIGFDRDYNPVWVRRETEKLVPVEQGPAPSVIAKRIFNYNERTKFEAKTEYEWGLIGFDILQNEIKNPIAWNECKQPLYVKIQTKEK